MNLDFVQNWINDFQDKKILVVGDMMLDHYIWGGVNRISQEAPVPVVDVENEEYRLGGAANVALNIRSLGAIPLVVGVTGNDNHLDEMKTLFWKKGISTEGLISDESRPTTVKSRVVAHNQQVVRIDFEKKNDVNSEIEDLVIAFISEKAKECNAIILEDYNKGLLTPKIIKNTIKIAKKNKIPVTVDPKFKNFLEYKNSTVFKPNLVELAKNTDSELDTEEDFIAAGNKLRKSLNAEYVIVTRSEKGLMIFGDKKEFNIPTFAKEVYDVSGAGDTVISTLTLGIACGLDMQTAAILANHAAGQVCGKIGIKPAYPEDILNSIKLHNEIANEG